MDSSILIICVNSMSQLDGNIGNIMTHRMLTQFHILFIKDYKILKIAFIIFASYLIIEEFYTFFELKPTYTSEEKRDLNVNDFPDILLCPEPSMNINAVISRGYPGSGTYYKGILSSKTLDQLTWAGNNSEDVKNVSNEISMLKSIEDCPQGPPRSFFWFKNNNSQTRENVNFILTRALSPYHICCKVVPPKISQNYPMISLQFAFSNNSRVTSFTMFMADQMTSSFFDLHKSTMLGDKIISGDKGFINYKVKIIEEEKLQDDPKYPCIDYNIHGQYATCVENEMIRQNFLFLNCTPPWMTYHEDFWCTGKHKLESKSAGENFFHFMSAVSASEASSGKCLVPCKVKRFNAKEIGKREKINVRGIYVIFEREVAVTKSSWALDGITLLSKIGGFIGISKNLSWLIILLLSSVGVVLSYLRQPKVKIIQ